MLSGESEDALDESQVVTAAPKASVADTGEASCRKSVKKRKQEKVS